MVFPLAATASGGFMSAHASQKTGQIVFLLRNGRVEYKTAGGA
jgi:hypothetical protein